MFGTALFQRTIIMKLLQLTLVLFFFHGIYCADEVVVKGDNCDYYGLDIVVDDGKILRLDGLNNQQCEESCIRKRECSHFTSSVHGCFLKHAEKRQDAVNTFAIYIGSVCGMFENRFPKYS